MDGDLPRQFPVRVIALTEYLAKRGPCTLAEIATDLGIPRVSAWRGLQVLRESGWVRVWSRGSRYELSARAGEILASAHYAQPESDCIDAFIEGFRFSAEFDVRAGFLHGPALYTPLEIHSVDHSRAAPKSLIYDLGPRTAALACSRKELQRFISLYSRSVSITPDERLSIDSGEFFREICASSKVGLVAGEDSFSLGLPVRFPTGAIGAIELHSKKKRRRDARRMLEIMRAFEVVFSFLACLPGSLYSSHACEKEGKTEACEDAEKDRSEMPLALSSASWLELFRSAESVGFPSFERLDCGVRQKNAGLTAAIRTLWAPPASTGIGG